MKVDLHIHSIASGHGTRDTITDLAKAAAARSMDLIGISDHAPAMAGAASASYFSGLRHVPRKRFGVSLLFGAELNILSEEGDVDLSDDILSGLDYAIVSLHAPIYADRGARANTLACIRAMRHPSVRIIGHPDDPQFPICAGELVSQAKEQGVLIEINNASLIPGGYRGCCEPVDRELLTLCAAYRVPVIIGSDSHGREQIGDDRYARALMKAMNFPSSLIANDHPQLLRI